MPHRASFALAILVACLAWPSLAQQRPSGSASSVDQRAAALRDVVASVTSPDRELNIAHFERIMQEGDVQKINIAIRTLVASDDPVLRGLAMRGYVGVTRQLELEVELSRDEQAMVDQARVAPQGLASIRAPFRYLATLGQQQFRVKLWFAEASLRDAVGRVGSVAGTDDRHVTTYAVRGDRITFRTRPWWGATFACDFDLRPTQEATITGTLACVHADFTGPLRLVAPMF
jgi:hypothetical protein